MAAKFVAKEKAFVPAGRKVVSFTFDDFPISAAENGAALLESHGARGTFYACLGLAGTETPCGFIGGRRELLDIFQRGHECGCHTYGHLNSTRCPSARIFDDCRLNQKAIEEIADVQVRSFAYPFGNFNPACKRIIRELYRSARTVEPGINVARIDLVALHAVPLYQRLGVEKAKHWLKTVDKNGGWLIFYTHDVACTPSVWGCSIDLLSQILDFCDDAGFQILTVGEVTEMCASENSCTDR